ncbi:MAG: hypothetical protein N2C14_30795, partial [Planctomycetales bacterium]
MTLPIPRRFLVAVSLAVLVLSVDEDRASAEPGNDLRAAAELRRPVAMALDRQGKRLFVANRCGSVSIIDVGSRTVAAEFPLGARLAHLVRLKKRNVFLAVDEAANELIVFRSKADSLETVARLGIKGTPVRVTASADESRCHVSCLWSRRLVIVDLTSLENPRIAKSLPLPFSPRGQLPLPARNQLVVTDSFGGWLAILDLKADRILASRELDAHNIRGMALSNDGSKILLPAQVLSPEYATTQGSVHWGNVMSNVVRELDVDSLAVGRPELTASQNAHYLG